MIDGVLPPTRAFVDSSAIRHNLDQVRRRAPQSRILAVIKANAYGHGLVRVADALQDADALAVARVKEGIILRKAGVSSRIVVLQGFLDRDELDAHHSFQLDPVVHGFHQLQLLSSCAYLDKLRLWLKLDTGMNRLGFQQSDWQAVLEWLKLHHNQWAELTWMTHLANADDVSDSTTINQINIFRNFTTHQTEPLSIANSAGILGWKQSHSEWVRPGLMLYGISPFADRTGAEFGLRPAMRLQSRLVSIKQLQVGDAVGYGGDWVCTQPIRLGVVAIGYGDGYPRSAQPGSLVMINEVKVPVVGRISMDMLTVDLTQITEVQQGDEVILWGEQLAVENLAKSSATIAYTLLCGITRRVEITEVTESTSERDKHQNIALGR